MAELTREFGAAGEGFTLCRWQERPEEGLALPFQDSTAAAQWLRQFRIEDLRRAAFEVLDGEALWRATDAYVTERLASAIVGGVRTIWISSTGCWVVMVMRSPGSVDVPRCLSAVTSAHKSPK